MQVKLAAEEARLKAQEAEKKQQLQSNAKSDATFVHPNPEESILDYSIAPVAMADGFENLQSDYSTDEDEKPTKNNKQRPDWSKRKLTFDYFCIYPNFQNLDNYLVL